MFRLFVSEYMLNLSLILSAILALTSIVLYISAAVNVTNSIDERQNFFNKILAKDTNFETGILQKSYMMLCTYADVSPN